MSRVHAARSIILSLALSLVAASLHAALPLKLDKDQYTFVEGNAPGTVTVLRLGPVSDPLTVNYFWRYQVSGEPEPSAGGTLTFAPGETSKTISISISNDNIYTWHTGGIDGLHLGGYVEITSLDGKDRISAGFTILEDDPVPIVGGPPPIINVPEGNSGTTAIPLHFTLSAPFAVIPSLLGNGFITESGSADAGDYFITRNSDVDYTV